jgi:CysZ protein
VGPKLNFFSAHSQPAFLLGFVVFLGTEPRASQLEFISGITYNLRGLTTALGTPRLLLLGLVRFMIMAAVTVVLAAWLLSHHETLLSLMWQKPTSGWLVWFWQLISWMAALLGVAISAVIAFILAQLLFSVFIMDLMSRITERKICGFERASASMPVWTYFLYLIKQELPRAILPVLISLVILIIGALTPASPLVAVASPLAMGLFLAWDNTDLVPARRLVPFRQRLAFLGRHLLFHLGFGLWFLVPGLNVLFFSFAPVGATLFYIEQIDGGV